MKNNENLKTLSNQVIQSLWQNKEYRNFPVELLKHFRRQSNISDAAVMCWQALYEMAFFDKDWSIQISKNSLSQEINKSPASVARLLNELEREGYIWRSQKKYKGYDLSSRIYVTLPQDAIDAIAEKPDRKKVAQECGTVDYSVDVNEVEIEQIEVKKKVEDSEIELEEDLSDCTTARCLIYETPYSNINNNINNNREVTDTEPDIVVSFFGNEQKVVDNSEQIAKLENEVSESNKKMDNIYSKLAVLKGKENQQEIDRLWEDIKIQSQRQSDVTLRINKLKMKKKPNVALRDGQRMLDRVRLKRICEASLGFTNGDISKARDVALHVVHAIRFGSLSKTSYKTGKTMTIAHAVNTAIGLLREKRWENPKNTDKLVA